MPTLKVSKRNNMKMLLPGFGGSVFVCIKMHPFGIEIRRVRR